MHHLFIHSLPGELGLIAGWFDGIPVVVISPAAYPPGPERDQAVDDAFACLEKEH